MNSRFKKIAVTVLTSLTMFTGTLIPALAAHTETADASTTASFSKIHKVAKSKLGKHYSWGSVGPNSFDCSGFTKYVYKKATKKSIPRTAQAQYNKYKHVSYKNIKKGDLVFFGGSKHSISHVGLYVGGGKMIDAQNRGVVTEAVHAPWWHAVGYARVANVK